MFELFTERARRVIFFARYEASEFGSISIDVEHLMLGILRADPNIVKRYLPNPDSDADIRRGITAGMTVQEKLPITIDVPLAAPCRQILAHAAREAESLNHQFIGTEHLLLGVLLEGQSAAAEVLRAHGLDVSNVRQRLAATGPSSGEIGTHAHPNLPDAGCVPDAETAMRIAEAVWLPLHGEEAVKRQKPFHVNLDNDIWTVQGSPSAEEPGGALAMQIRKVDAGIVSLAKRSQ